MNQQSCNTCDTPIQCSKFNKPLYIALEKEQKLPCFVRRKSTFKFPECISRITIQDVNHEALKWIMEYSK